MTTLLIILVILLIAGIIWFNKDSAKPAQNREQFLDKLTHFLEAQKTPLLNRPNSFLLTFAYEGDNFVFEDVEEQGFGEKTYKAFLKNTTGKPFTLYFLKKETKQTKHTSILGSGSQPDQKIKNEKIELPKSLKDFDVFTNNAIFLQEILKDRVLVALFAGLKTGDSSGYAFMPLIILNGVVSLEFRSSSNYKPNLMDLRSNVSSVEVYLKKVCSLLKFVNKKYA